MQSTPTRVEEHRHKSAAVPVFLIDNADEKSTSKVLSESEAKNRRISENTGEMIWQFDLDTNRFVYVSPSGLRLFGFTPEEILGKSMEALLTPQSMQYVSMRLPEAITALNAGDESARVTTHELEQVRKDGFVVPTEVVITLLQDATGRVDRIAGVSRDITEQRKAAEALRESETQYRALFEAMTEGVAFHEIVYDEKGTAVDYRITSTNSAFEKHTGLKSEQVLGKLAGKVYGADKAPYLDRYALVASTGEPDSFETYFPPMNRFFHISVTSPKRGCFVTVFQNITERKQAEDALQESRQRLADIIDFLPDATFVINKEGEVIAWNRAIEEMTGIKASDMLGKDNYEYALPFYGERRPTLIDLALRPRTDFLSKYTGTARTANGIVGEAFKPALKTGSTYLYGTASVLRDSLGNVVGAIESIRDMTERKRALDALRESEERFSRFFRASPVGTSILHLTEGRFADANDAFLDLFGYTRDEVVGHNPLELSIWVDPDDREQMFKTLLKNGRIRDFETRFRRKPGEIVDVRFSAEVIEAADQKYLLGLLHDITERKRAEEEKETLENRLRQAQKLEAIGTLAGGIAHDFNNLLQPMIGYTEIVLNELPPSNPMRDDLEQALSASLRAKELVRQILSVSRSTQQQQRIPIDVSPIFKEVMKLLRSSLPTSIEIRQDISAGIALADPTQIHQVLMNLCTNAAHAMGDKGIMEVRLSPVDLSESDLAEKSIVGIEPGPYLELSVSDTGTGMDLQTMERIFEPYYTTKDVGKGSGLGLAVVHGIVRRHDGAVSVKSAPGKGSTFIIYIPRIKAADTVPSETHREVPTGTERILLLDDEQAVGATGTAILERQGYKVTCETDSSFAIEKFKANPNGFDLVITDYTMPHLTGVDLAREARRLRPDIPILLCTGLGERITPEKVKEFGMELLMKPYGLRQLSEKVRKILDSRKGTVV